MNPDLQAKQSNYGAWTLPDLYQHHMRQYSKEGDTVKFLIIWNPRGRPRFMATFCGEEKDFTVEYSDFLGEVPNPIDPVTKIGTGFSTWREALTSHKGGIALFLEQLTRNAGRIVTVREEKAVQIDHG